jgi:hypothetical protein
MSKRVCTDDDYTGDYDSEDSWQKAACAAAEEAELFHCVCHGSIYMWGVHRVLFNGLPADVAAAVFALVFDLSNNKLAPALKGLNLEQSIFVMRFYWNKVANTQQIVCLHGAGGTGKSFTISALSQLCPLQITAPTGSIALQNSGNTLQQFIGLANVHTVAKAKKHIIAPYKAIEKADYVPPNCSWWKDVHQKWSQLSTLVIDEISMTAQDVLVFLDWLLRQLKNAELCFGGIDVVFMGDWGQLAQMDASEALYLLDVWTNEWRPMVYELTRPMRHKDDIAYFNLLTNARFGRWDPIMDTLMSRVVTSMSLVPDNAIYLCGKNETARSINNRFMDYREDGFVYTSVYTCEPPLIPRDEDPHLTLRRNCSVIFRRNIYTPGVVDICNGQRGTVVGFVDASKYTEWQELVALEACLLHHRHTPDVDAYVPVVQYKSQDGKVRRVVVQYHTDTKTEQKHVAGSKEAIDVTTRLTYMPLQNGPAQTVHMSQGKTFECVAINGEMWADGMFYVALARVKSLFGLYILISTTNKEQQMRVLQRCCRTDKRFISHFSRSCT